MRVFVVDCGTYGAEIVGVFPDEGSARTLGEASEGRVSVWSVLRELPREIPPYGPLGADPSGDEPESTERPPVLFLVMTGVWSDYRLDAVLADEAMAERLASMWTDAVVERVAVGSVVPARVWIVRLGLATGELVASARCVPDDATQTAIGAGVCIGRLGWATRQGLLPDETIFGTGDTEAEATKRARDFRASLLAAPDAEAGRRRLLGVRPAHELAEVRRLHDELGAAVARTRAVLARWSAAATLPRIDREALAPLLDETAELATVLGRLLDALDRALGNEGATPSAEPPAVDEVRAFLRAVEPAPATTSFHPGAARRSTPLGAMPDFYGALVEIDNVLLERSIPRSFTWRQTIELWTSLVYLGGTHAGGGLPSRLDFIGRLPGRRTSPRAVEHYPWDRTDLVELERLARRATFLARAPQDELDLEEATLWCTLVDGWLLAGPDALIAGEVILAGILRETPPPTPAVAERLRRIAGMHELSEPTRSAARARLEGAEAPR